MASGFSIPPRKSPLEYPRPSPQKTPSRPQNHSRAVLVWVRPDRKIENGAKPPKSPKNHQKNHTQKGGETEEEGNRTPKIGSNEANRGLKMAKVAEGRPKPQRAQRAVKKNSELISDITGRFTAQSTRLSGEPRVASAQGKGRGYPGSAHPSPRPRTSPDSAC